jgi:DNA-binding LacI/PurR family transcriptional regulator
MVTMQDIAEKAGVNKGTVSYVLNGKQKKARIGAETCARILAVAKELGYRRNELARSVATGKSNVIAFVSWNTGTCEYIGKIMSGILEEISMHGYSLKVYHMIGANSFEIAAKIIQQRADGVIFHASENSDFKVIREEMKKNHIPCAVTNLTSRYSDVGVTTDDFQGTKDAVRHLAELGHRRILYISHKSSVRNTEYIVNREAGYIAGMKEFVGDNAEIEIKRVKAGKFADQVVLRELLFPKDKKRPTAIICINDTLAMELMQVAYFLGIKLPDELSLIGFADLEMAKFAVVPLTTIAQPFELMGRQTAKTLLEIIENKNINDSSKIRNKKLEVNLVIRNSTVPLHVQR